MILTEKHLNYWHYHQEHNARCGGTHGKRIKIWTSKQMLQRLPTAVAQVKAGNTAEN